MPRLIAPKTCRGVRGSKRGPSPSAYSLGDVARHDVVRRGIANRVHARRCRTRREHGVHAPVPGTTCHWLDAVVATRNSAARAGAQGSPPLVLPDVRWPRATRLVTNPSMRSMTIPSFISRWGPLYFWILILHRNASTGNPDRSSCSMSKIMF